MITHKKFKEAITLMKINQPILLTGERGSGKTTLAMQLAEKMGLDFFSLSMTRQTTLSHLAGFINVNGEYIPSHLRNCAENGGVMLLDEIDASDPNVILFLNTIENGFITFPDKLVTLNENFRLIATANPQDKHHEYNARAKLDASTMDRFDIISVERDDNIESVIVSKGALRYINLARDCLKKQNSSTYISMRDSIRFQKRMENGIQEGYVEKLLAKDLQALEDYKAMAAEMPSVPTYEDCKTLNDVWSLTSCKL